MSNCVIMYLHTTKSDKTNCCQQNLSDTAEWKKMCLNLRDQADDTDDDADDDGTGLN